MPPFVPEATPAAMPEAPKEHMVVMTIRVDPKKRDALHRFYRQRGFDEYKSISHVVQTAINEFLERHA